VLIGFFVQEGNMICVVLAPFDIQHFYQISMGCLDYLVLIYAGTGDVLLFVSTIITYQRQSGDDPAAVAVDDA
jgi:hypothetical protein